VNEKLIRRHPHVFGDGRLDTSEQVLVQWEQIKAQEKKHGAPVSRIFKDLPPRLPALMLAEAVWKQIEKKRLPAAGAVDTAQIAALGPQLTAEALGRMLFEIAAASREKGLDPEEALRLHTNKVMQAVEQKVAADLRAAEIKPAAQAS